MVTRLGNRRVATLVVAVVASAAVAPWAITVARAATLTEFFGGTTTTTTVADMGTTESSVAVPDTAPTTSVQAPDGGSAPGETTSDVSIPETVQPLASAEGTPALAGTGDGAELSDTASQVFPPELQAMTDSVVRTGARSSRPLMDALAPLTNYGMSPEQAVLSGFGRFPVAGLANYSHDWWFPRFGPSWRLHEGTDIFAPFNTPVRASASGRIHITQGGLGGLAVYVIEPNRNYWYLAHLAGLAQGIVEGAEVSAGQIVGFVGDSGNAKGGASHLHLEFHPGGGPAVDPKATLDLFLDEAIAGAPALIAAEAQRATAATAAAEAERAANAVANPLSLDGPGRSALLWASSMNPAGGAIEVAQAEALRAVTQIDWQQLWRDQQQDEWDQMLAGAMVRVWLHPLTPPALTAILGSS